MERVTMGMLEKKVDYLNKLTGNASTPWTRGDDGKLTANIGNYHLSGAYGGWCLHQMDNEGGGVHVPFNCGYVPKRELFYRICAFIDGIQAGRED